MDPPADPDESARLKSVVPPNSGRALAAAHPYGTSLQPVRRTLYSRQRLRRSSDRATPDYSVLKNSTALPGDPDNSLSLSAPFSFSPAQHATTNLTAHLAVSGSLASPGSENGSGWNTRFSLPPPCPCYRTACKYMDLRGFEPLTS